MKILATSLILACMAAGAAMGQQTGLPGGIPLNQIMPQLPPVPEPANRLPKQSHRPCADARAQVPTGGAAPATTASRTPEGIGLYGGEESEQDVSDGSTAETVTPCPPPR